MVFAIFRLTSAILAVYGLIQCAISFSLPVSAPTANESALTTSQTTSLTFSPWPPRPFYVYMPDTNHYLLFFMISSWDASPAVPLQDLISFVIRFSERLEHEYPPPGYGPRSAKSTEIDVTSYTKWRLEIGSAWLGKNARTSLMLRALREYEASLRKHGPASIYASIGEMGRMPRPMADPTMELVIEKLEGVEGLNGTGSGGASGTFETS
ncbi:hypothetical protein N7G274_009662 [Stereocaulon virgatum]|uniref:Uncharacterized protein n=1 Tax=Stereocaulon virgatum TaxID=373712 RepID=A0ABR3ZVB0_9LECA